MGIFANRIWHAWAAFPLFAGAVLAVVGTAVGYVAKVVAPRYPRK